MYLHVYVHMYVHAYVHAYVHTYVHMYVHAHIYNVHVCMRVYTCVYMIRTQMCYAQKYCIWTWINCEDPNCTLLGNGLPGNGLPGNKLPGNGLPGNAYVVHLVKASYSVYPPVP